MPFFRVTNMYLIYVPGQLWVKSLKPSFRNPAGAAWQC